MQSHNSMWHVKSIGKQTRSPTFGNSCATMRASTRKCYSIENILTAPSLKKEWLTVSENRNSWTNKKLMWSWFPHK